MSKVGRLCTHAEFNPHLMGSVALGEHFRFDAFHGPERLGRVRLDDIDSVVCMRCETF